jgi:Holliday junction resolvase
METFWENRILIFIISLTFIFAISILAIKFWWESTEQKRRIKKSRIQGQKGEERAVVYLIKKGYAVKEQVALTETVLIDNKPVEFGIRPDIIATIGKHRWVIDVKTGKSANIKNDHTRRQLREYAAYFPGFKIGLINGDKGKLSLQEVDFTSKKIKSSNMTKHLFTIFILGLITGILITLQLKN